MEKRKLKDKYLRMGITSCELRLEDCMGSYFLTFAHRMKRRFYKKDLWTFDETVLACVKCHEKIEYDRKLTKKMFEKLRG